MVEIARVVKCSLTQNSTIARAVIMMKLLWRRIVHRYSLETTFNDVEPLEEKEKQPLALVEEKAMKEDKLEDDEAEPSN